MASVQELIAAVQATQEANRPFKGLLEVYDTYKNSRDRAVDTSIKLMQREQLRLENEYMKKQREAEIATATEEENKKAFAGVGGVMSKPAVLPVQKLANEAMEVTKTVDAKGHTSYSYKTKPPKEIDPTVEALKAAQTDYYKERAGDIKEQQEERDYKRKERRNTERTKIIDRFNADASVKKSQQSVDAANMIRGLVDSGNPIAAASIPTFMARASGEVGNLSEADKQPFGGSQAILQRLAAVTRQAADGKLTEDNARFIRELSGIMEKRANDNISALAKKRAKQYSSASDFLDEQDIFSSLVPEMQDINESPQPTSIPKVGGKFNGEKVLKVERID